jgi:hypothetical protein
MKSFLIEITATQTGLAAVLPSFLWVSELSVVITLADTVCPKTPKPSMEILGNPLPVTSEGQLKRRSGFMVAATRSRNQFQLWDCFEIAKV